MVASLQEAGGTRKCPEDSVRVVDLEVLVMGVWYGGRLRRKVERADVPTRTEVWPSSHTRPLSSPSAVPLACIIC